MLPRIFRLGCQLALPAAVLVGCGLLIPEPQPAPAEPPVAPPLAPNAMSPQLPIIFFSADGDSLDIGAREKIEMIASIAQDARWADHSILVKGHSDAQGDSEYNQELARRRAELVAGELVFANVPRDRIIVQAAGADEPLAPNQQADGSDNPAGRALNRRVEVRLLTLPTAP
jgi:OOP family OmpA-OmpF porin